MKYTHIVCIRFLALSCALSTMVHEMKEIDFDDTNAPALQNSNQDTVINLEYAPMHYDPKPTTQQVKRSCWPYELCPQRYDQESFECRKNITKKALITGGILTAIKLCWASETWIMGSSCRHSCTCIWGGTGDCSDRLNGCINIVLWGINGVIGGSLLTSLGAWLPYIKNNSCCCKSTESNN